MMCKNFPDCLIDGKEKMNGTVTPKGNASRFASALVPPTNSGSQAIVDCQ